MLNIETARSWYPEYDPVHGFDHILRVYRMVEKIGREEGADLEILRAAALLHDVQGGRTSGGEEGRSNHHHESSEFARQILDQEGWSPERISAVQHCIQAHRFRDETETPQTLEAKILFDADKLDVIGAVGIARTIAYDVVVSQPIYIEPSASFLQSGVKEPGEAHSSYHEYLFKLIKIKDRLYTEAARAIAAERHMFLTEYFERLAAEERGEK